MGLNPEQNQILEFKKGPLLIIAGAGTGKTRGITSRIVHLLKTKKAKPSEILALTFTEKAANEMTERVDETMPLGYEELCIRTFHSFSERILREAGFEMGIDPGFTILDKVQQWFFFKKNLFAFDLDYYRPLGNPNKFIYGLLDHFNKLKDELISPEAYLEYADEDKTKEIAEAYRKYNELLIQNNYLDFGDLTYYVIELFKKRKNVLQEYQNRYKHILVDEFQDTNYAQFQLVTMLADAHQNIVVVGDDDQSIYKWRGASLSNILKFQEKFPDHKKIILIENYRSSKNILDGAYGLIQNNNPDRLEVKAGINKQLKCNKDYPDPIEIHHFTDFIQESGFLAEKIKVLRKQGAAYGDIAVLVRSNNLANPIIDDLKYEAIPYQVRNPKGILSIDEIKDLIAVIRFLSNPKNNIALLRILKMDVFKVPMKKILEFLDNGRRDGLEEIFDLLSGLIEFSKKNSVGSILNEFLNKSDYLTYLIENEKFEELDNINEFAKQISRFERENEHRSVIDFSSYLNLLEEANAPLGYEGFVDRDSVQILTAHSAKGLQFDYVFIMNAVSGRFPVRKRRDAFEIPEDLTNEIYPEGDYHEQEERRLFYVAMTRAKKNLFITYSDQYEGNKAWKVSPFVTEVEESGKSVLTHHQETEDALKRLRTFKEPNKPIFDLPPFKGNHLSYSQLDTFNTCPLKYNYRYIMKAPVLASHQMNFGISVHNTLKDFYQVLKRGEKASFELMQELYEKNWISYGYESKEHEETRKEKGLEVLRAFCDANGNPWIIPAFLERKFKLRLGDFWLEGRIDRVDKLEDGTYEVIDYKTGRMKDDIRSEKDLQLSIYALACRDVFDLPVSKLSLYFLEDNQKISTTRSEDQLKKLPEELNEIIQQIQKSDFSPVPGFLCQFCDYKLICPAA